MQWLLSAPLLTALLLGTAAGPVPADPPAFAIEVVDAETGRGVPLVELTTVHNLRFITDSAGIAAIDAPELNGIEVHFRVSSHGYEYPADGFGIRGIRLTVEPGKVARVELPRVNIAERLYRVTGGGIYGESVKIGRETPLETPLSSGLVFGQDSVFTIPYRGQLWWFWGDTNKPSYPLGNFHMSGAVSDLPDEGGLDPEVGVNLRYFVDDNGFSRDMAQMPGDGPTWLSGFAVLADEGGRERLYAGYAKIKPPLATYERGICVYRDDEERFERLAVFPSPEALHPNGHAIKVDDRDGSPFLYFATPYPLVRVAADPDAIIDPTRYETFTCLEDDDEPKVERDADGNPVYRWRSGAEVLDPRRQAELISGGTLAEGEGLLNLRDVETGDPVLAHAGTVAPNPYRGRWVMITTQLFGRSMLGEIWYAEADSPLGPWAFARRIISHEKYSYYNPMHHRHFDADGGRRIFVEGTYTTLFSGNESPTPRYDYNQIMYGIDLDDPRLNLPVAFYRVGGRGGVERFRTADGLGDQPAGGTVAFFALERPAEGTVPVVEEEGEALRLKIKGDDDASPLFHAIAADGNVEVPGTVPLFAVRDPNGAVSYEAGDRPLPKDWERIGDPVCRVWSRPGPERQPLFP